MRLNMETPIIPAVRNLELLPLAITAPSPKIFLLAGEICELPDIADNLKKAGKEVYIHLELIKGLATDEAAVRYLAGLGTVKGIISTRFPILRAARENGLEAVLRIFIIDSRALDTAESVFKQAKPSIVEVLPGYLPDWVYQELIKSFKVPVVAGGLLKEKADIRYCLSCGVSAVTVSEASLWHFNFKKILLKHNA